MRESVVQTRITDYFGIRHPIVVGGLMWLADAEFVSAVVRAGGMGFITAWSFRDPVAFKDEVQKAKELTGGLPFGVNISVSRRPGINDMMKPHIQIAIDEGVKFVETSGSSPAHILPELQGAGIKVMHKVPSVRYALAAQREGVDAIAVVGSECGGHPGYMMMGSMVQAALASEQITLPLLIGGGIGTGRQVLGAMAMGADGVLMGTRMLVAEEMWSHPDYKQRVAEGSGEESCVVMSKFKLNHRVLRNDAAEEVLAMEAAGETDIEKYRPLIDGQLVREAYETGDYSTGMIDYGQAVSFANKVQSVEAIYDELVDDLVAARTRLSTF